MQNSGRSRTASRIGQLTVAFEIMLLPTSKDNSRFQRVQRQALSPDELAAIYTTRIESSYSTDIAGGINLHLCRSLRLLALIAVQQR